MPVDNGFLCLVALSYFGGGWREVPGNVSICMALHFSFRFMYNLYAEVTAFIFAAPHLTKSPC